MQGVKIYSVEFNLAKPDCLVSEIGGSRIFKSSDNLGKMITVESDDWRTPLVCYLENPGRIAYRKVR
jgi:hypothetical protein